MAKGSGRFRNRKLGFKTRINVEVGVVIEEDPLDEHLEVEDAKGHKGVETGVDKDEEGEVHLQAVIASTAAYVSRATTGSGGDKDKGKNKQSQAYIPTRAATEISDAEYRKLYKPGYVDPFSYIRFSDTVEDCVKGAATYTMDEDDEDWLEDFNARFFAGAGAGEDGEESSGRGARAKGKGVANGDGPEGAGLASLSPTSALSEDDFELVMEVFELVTDQKAPMAHINLDLLPSLDDFDEAFLDVLKPHLAKLRPYAKDVYPHWRSRRVARGGKQVIPQLDYDESNENNPYVCFRRRELKTSRKTRRSDQQNLERLIRLRNDLYAAHALMTKVAERERIKLDALDLERKVFDERVAMRELKRRLNEPEGDEELLISRREKKRKREDPANGSLRLSIRKPDPNNLSPAALVLSQEELQARKARNEAMVKQIERDLARKRQGDQHWDDWTDSSYLARPPPTPARFWRAVEPVPNSVPFNGPAGQREALGFATNYQPPLGRVRPSFRKRIGRGGRVLLDRITMGWEDAPPSSSSSRRRRLPLLVEDGVGESDAEDEDAEEAAEEEDEWLAMRRAERFKYDTDCGLDFPTADEPVLLDDFDIPYLLRRVNLLKAADLEALSVDSSYLEEAFRFVSHDLSKDQLPPIVVGRPPPRPPLQMAPSQAAAAAASPLPGGVGGPQPPNAAAYAQAQQQLAAQQALRLQQQAAAMRKSQQAAAMAAVAAGGTGGGSDQMRRTPSQGGGVSPVAGQQGSPMPQLPLTMPNGAPVPPGSSPASQFHPGGPFPPQGSPLSNGGGVNGGLPLPPQPPRPNGLAGSPQSQLINGANGLPATSRLSAPPYSNNAALAMALQAQQQQQQQQLAAAAAAAGGSPVMMAARPTSAASQHGQHPSPHLQNGVPLPVGTPPPGQVVGQKRASPMVVPQGMQMGPNGYPMQMNAAKFAAAQQQQGGYVQG
ncbi:hypothetical protein JCM8547_006940 [Rhodosporidiobolus lusitaniae]